MKTCSRLLASLFVWCVLVCAAMAAHVTPSGDRTGETDTAAINDALKQGSDEDRTVTLASGQYWTNAPLHVASKHLIGEHTTRINYVGPKTIDYAIRVTGKTPIYSAYLANVDVWCNRNCRGVLFAMCGSRSIARSVNIIAPRQIGADVIDCWSCRWEDVSIYDGLGVGVRMIQCMSFSSDRLAIATRCFTCSIPSQFDAMFVYACQHGIEKTKRRYNGEHGFGQYLEDWPDPDDDSVMYVDQNGVTRGPFRTPVEERAPLIVGGGGEITQDLTSFRNLILEPCYCADYPSIVCEAMTTRFDDVRWEKGGYRGPLVLIPARAQTYPIRGCNLEFANCRVVGSPLGNLGRPSCVLKVIGNSEHIELRNIYTATNVRPNLVVLDGGTHRDIRIVGHGQIGEYIPPGKLIQLDNGATLERSPMPRQ